MTNKEDQKALSSIIHKLKPFITGDNTSTVGGATISFNWLELEEIYGLAFDEWGIEPKGGPDDEVKRPTRDPTTAEAIIRLADAIEKVAETMLEIEGMGSPEPAKANRYKQFG